MNGWNHELPKGLTSGVPERVSIPCPTCSARHDLPQITETSHISQLVNKPFNICDTEVSNLPQNIAYGSYHAKTSYIKLSFWSPLLQQLSFWSQLSGHNCAKSAKCVYNVVYDVLCCTYSITPLVGKMSTICY